MVQAIRLSSTTSSSLSTRRRRSSSGTATFLVGCLASVVRITSYNVCYTKLLRIEWAKDGETGKLFIVQARPETVHTLKDKAVLREFHLKEKGEVVCTGQSVGELIGQGGVNVIKSAQMISQFQKGQVLVTDMTDPDWEPVMKIAGAIVTNRGGRTCHAAIVSRELGIPCIVGAGNATARMEIV